MGDHVGSWIESSSSSTSSSHLAERPRDTSPAPPVLPAVSTPAGSTPAGLQFGHLTPVSASSAVPGQTFMGSQTGRASVDAHSVRLKLKVEQLSQQLQAVERRNQAMQRQLERGTAREVKLQQQNDEEARRHAARVAQLERAHAETVRLATEERDSVAEERDVLAAMAADVEDDNERRGLENDEMQRQNEILQQQNAELQATLDAKTAESAAAGQDARVAAESAEAKLLERTADAERGLEEIARLRKQVAALQQANAELNMTVEQITRLASKIAGAITTGP